MSSFYMEICKEEFFSRKYCDKGGSDLWRVLVFRRSTVSRSVRVMLRQAGRLAVWNLEVKSQVSLGRAGERTTKKKKLGSA